MQIEKFISMAKIKLHVIQSDLSHKWHRYRIGIIIYVLIISIISPSHCPSFAQREKCTENRAIHKYFWCFTPELKKIGKRKENSRKPSGFFMHMMIREYSVGPFEIFILRSKPHLNEFWGCSMEIRDTE